MIKTVSYDNDILIPEAGKLIAEGHTVTMTVRGRSMRPFIENDRDKVVLSAPNNIKVGDVVLARTLEKGFVIHRITTMDTVTGNAILRGDGNLDLEHCNIKDVLAKITNLIICKNGKEKSYSVESLRWRSYSWLWVRLRPIRKYLLAIYRLRVGETSFKSLFKRLIGIK